MHTYVHRALDFSSPGTAPCHKTLDRFSREIAEIVTLSIRRAFVDQAVATLKRQLVRRVGERIPRPIPNFRRTFRKRAFHHLHI